jgi:protein ImuB
MSDAESSALLDQLNARLGERACTGIAARNQHAPESAWAPIRHRGGRNRGATLPDLPRPLWLFDPPHLTDRERLTLLKGPERLQTDWWRQTIWRDYYVACLENGAKCWAFVDARNQWYLHGYFG